MLIHKKSCPTLLGHNEESCPNVSSTGSEARRKGRSVTTTTPFTVVPAVPATPDRWPDLEALFGPEGEDAGCWCMFWRLPPVAFKQLKGEGAGATPRDLV